MTTPSPSEVNFFIEHLGKILGAIAVAFLTAMSYISKNRNKKAEIAKAVLTETPVSHTELLRCQMEINVTIADGFKELRKELMTEIKYIHERINKL